MAVALLGTLSGVEQAQAIGAVLGRAAAPGNDVLGVEALLRAAIVAAELDALRHRIEIGELDDLSRLARRATEGHSETPQENETSRPQPLAMRVPRSTASNGMPSSYASAPTNMKASSLDAPVGTRSS